MLIFNKKNKIKHFQKRVEIKKFKIKLQVIFMIHLLIIYQIKVVIYLNKIFNLKNQKVKFLFIIMVLLITKNLKIIKKLSLVNLNVT